MLKLKQYKNDYFNNIIPKFDNSFELNLFNTFRSYAFPKKIIILKSEDKFDERGSLWEILKTKKCSSFVSTTKKNKIRGNHFHTKKLRGLLCFMAQP